MNTILSNKTISKSTICNLYHLNLTLKELLKRLTIHPHRRTLRLFSAFLFLPANLPWFRPANFCSPRLEPAKRGCRTWPRRRLRRRTRRSSWTRWWRRTDPSNGKQVDDNSSGKFFKLKNVDFKSKFCFDNKKKITEKALAASRDNKGGSGMSFRQLVFAVTLTFVIATLQNLPFPNQLSIHFPNPARGTLTMLGAILPSL